MNDRPDVSVVIPAHNAETTLAEQLDAVLAQHATESFEVVVVDNASTDATARLVDDYARRDARVRLVNATDGRGPSHARNVGVRAARADLIVCCDADDVVAPGWLSALAESLLDHEIVAGVLEVDSLNAPDVVAARGASVPGSAGDFHGVTFPHGCAMGFRRDTYLGAGGLDERLRAGEEIDLAIRLAARGVRVHEVRDAVVHYRFRHDETDQWNQAFEGGRVKPHLCRAARRADLARPSRVAGLRNWLWLVRTLPQRHDPVIGRRRRWVLASRCGQVAGCWRYRTVYL